MKLITQLIIGILAVVMPCKAQVVSPFTRKVLPPGRYEINSEPDGVGSKAVSLNQLIAISELIIEGTIDKVHTSSRRVSSEPMTIWTYSLVHVNRLIRGELPGGSLTIALNQMGGISEGYGILYSFDPLVKPGERYILFLRNGRRTEPTNSIGTPLCWTVGSGKITISDEGKIHFVTEVTPGLQAFEGMDVNNFVAAIEKSINLQFGPPPPSSVTPGPLPKGVPIPPTGPPKPPSRNRL
jgi:hypothetical protein